MTKPLVSVIMNCYNGDAWLRKAIDSVLAQTYDSWELVFWDDYSTDGSADIVKSYQDSRIKYVYASVHLPLYGARNLAIEHASGELISFLDVDDWWEPNKLAAQVPFFDDPEVGFAAGNFWIENERKHTTTKAHSRIVPTGHVLNDLLENYYIGVLTLMVRRSALDAMPYMCDARYTVIGDFDLSIRLATQWKLGYVQEPIAHYRLHENNMMKARRTRFLEECDLWLDNTGKTAEVRSSPGLVGFRAEVDYSKALYELLDGRRRQAFRLSRFVPFGRFKARIWAALFMPLPLVRYLKD